MKNDYQTDENCIFCKIISGKVSAEKVYEDEHTLAFLNIQPNSPGHTLVISKDHFENIYTTPDEALCRLMIVVKKITVAIKNSLDTDGMTNVINSECAGHISHIHVHVIPRYHEDGFSEWPHVTYKEGEAELIREKIEKELLN